MAHKKGVGSTKNGRDSKPKYLGIKCSHNTIINAGTIIIRQQGLNFKAGENVGSGKDFTLFALKNGQIKYETLTNHIKKIKIINV